jgi:hypothetical protein
MSARINASLPGRRMRLTSTCLVEKLPSLCVGAKLDAVAIGRVDAAIKQVDVVVVEIMSGLIPKNEEASQSLENRAWRVDRPCGKVSGI